MVLSWAHMFLSRQHLFGLSTPPGQNSGTIDWLLHTTRDTRPLLPTLTPASRCLAVPQDMCTNIGRQLRNMQDDVAELQAEVDRCVIGKLKSDYGVSKRVCNMQDDVAEL